jgi:cell envelope opacity-associated protein A
MAQRGWEQGWPIYPWAEPIRKVVERKELEAKEKALAEEVERARQAAKIKDTARDEATQVHDEEGRLVKAARVNVIVLLNATARIGPAYQTLAEKLRVQIEQGDMDPTVASSLLRNLAAASAQMVKAGQTAMQIQRLYRGEPTDILGMAPVEMSLDDALAELKAGQADMERFNRKGLTVIEGGQSEEAAS